MTTNRDDTWTSVWMFAIGVTLAAMIVPLHKLRESIKTSRTRAKMWVSYVLGMASALAAFLGHLNGSMLALAYGLAGTWVFAMATGIFTERASAGRRS